MEGGVFAHLEQENLSSLKWALKSASEPCAFCVLCVSVLKEGRGSFCPSPSRVFGEGTWEYAAASTHDDAIYQVGRTGQLHRHSSCSRESRPLSHTGMLCYIVLPWV